MEDFKFEIKEKETLDVSREFLEMEPVDFRRFLKENKNKPKLKLEFDWIDVSTARKAKAFLENEKPGQKREVLIRATKEQRGREINVFESGVQWEEIF